MSFKSYSQLVAEAKSRIREVSAGATREALARGEPLALVDIREPNEWNLGRIPGAIHIPRGILESSIEGAIPRDRRVILYCASGNRSALAAETLEAMGYTDVASMAGGFKSWVYAGGEVEG